LLDAVAAGELHLTGLLMIGPHLTPANHLEVLARAKFRTKKELGRLVRELSPLPNMPDVIAALGPMLPRPARKPTWEQFTASLAPAVRELPAGERPCDWANDGHDHRPDDAATTEDDSTGDEGALPVGPVPVNLPPITGPQLYELRFGTVEEHVHLVERAKALLARSRPQVTLGELHLEAMKLLVAALEKRKFAVNEPKRPRLEASEGRNPPTQGPRRRVEASEGRAPLSGTPRQRVQAPDGCEPPTEPPRPRVEASEGREPPAEEPGRRSRYVPAAVRREVYRRDAARCTYVDARGLQCCETRYLELHHLQAFAKNGAHLASNLTLRCSAHNALAAEADFGKGCVVERRSSSRHEAFARARVEKRSPS
jgi:hypothetical protein